MAIFYDTHAHLDYEDFQPDFAALVERARAAGIVRMISIGTTLASSERAVRLAEQHEGIYAAVGWHPSDANEAPENVRPALRALAAHPKVVAIGEIGLDYYRLPSHRPGGTVADDEKYKANQARIFAQQMELAAELALPVVIHQRASIDAILDQMQPFVGRIRAVFHCFSEPPATLQRILAMNCLVSFTGILTFKNGQNVREALAATPMDAFMLETDCPYLTPEPYRKTVRRCEPAFVRETALVAAQVKGCSLEQLSAATCATAHRFFAKMPAIGG
jgi:TatD DNase family protein